MNAPLVLHPVAAAFELRSMWALPFSRIERDWFGSAPVCAAEYCLAANDAAVFLAFRASGLGWFEPVPGGSFIEGLWERDVAELFVCDGSGDGYQEFNFAPSGAWWSCHFGSYRVRDGSFNRSNSVECRGDNGPSGWRVCARIPAAAFCAGLPQVGRRANLTAILGREPRQYLSVARISGEPDFHKAASFPLLAAPC